MAQVSSEVEHVSPQDEAAAAETSIRSLLNDCSSIGDSVLRALVEEYAFQALSEGLLRKRLRYTVCAPEAHEGNDLLSLTFPRKLWRIVESNQFESIWWDETGTSIVINEELFKKEVLERKAPFNIFETQSMKSFVRQLNLYGFSKTGKNFQRSASLADFLAEEREASVFNKLQFYCNPNFKRGCPQLLMRMKRRVGTKTASPIPASLVQHFNKKPSCSGKGVGNQNTSSQAESRRETTASTSTNIHAPQIKKSSTSTAIANTVVPIRNSFSLPPLSLVSLPGPHALLNQQTPSYGRSPSSHTQGNGHLVNLVTAPTSQYLSPPQKPTAEPSTFPIGLPDYSTNEDPPQKLFVPGKKWILVPVMADTAASFLPRLTHKTSSA
ncbi:heat shock transcription factor, Y-linked-like [Echinops telfairi]|uniref:Heat shock transcription factor, Y-linked-like n=1 Tax=Echinops telfairi TaxID=9371 RepID=A0ABM0ZRB5_ECHTE|nr:heat shock transcription factor, Y-linked-like [Echinops telfairi]